MVIIKTTRILRVVLIIITRLQKTTSNSSEKSFLATVFFIGLPVYAYVFSLIFYRIKRVLQVRYGKIWRERVNRFTDIFCSMLTKILSCGIIKNDKKARLSEDKQDLGSERSGSLPEVYYFIIQKPYRFDTPM